MIDFLIACGANPNAKCVNSAVVPGSIGWAGQSIRDVFQAERPSLIQLRGPFDGFVEKAVRASTTCLIMANHNRCSIDARAAGRMVLVRSHAERIVVLYNDEIVAGHVSGPFAAVDLGLLHPLQKRLRHAADLARDRHNRRPS